jgi:hypothetical protein
MTRFGLASAAMLLAGRGGGEDREALFPNGLGRNPKPLKFIAVDDHTSR